MSRRLSVADAVSSPIITVLFHRSVGQSPGENPDEAPEGPYRLRIFREKIAFWTSIAIAVGRERHHPPDMNARAVGLPLRPGADGHREATLRPRAHPRE